MRLSTAAQYSLRVSLPDAKPTNAIDLDASDIDGTLHVQNGPGTVLENEGGQAGQAAVPAGGFGSYNKHAEPISVDVSDTAETRQASSSTRCRTQPSTGSADPTQSVDIDMPDADKNTQGSNRLAGSKGDAITVYGPRHIEGAEGGEASKVTAVIDRSMPFRLIIHFLGVTTKNMSQSQGQPRPRDQVCPGQQLGHPQVAQQAQGDTDDEGFQPPEKSSKRRQNKQNTGGKTKGTDR